jgi:hypothetical protein
LRTQTRLLICSLVVLGLTVVLIACSADEGAGPEIVLAPASVLPDHIRQGPQTVQEAYRFAVANQELISQFPCYCGCVHAGHESNLDCYIQEVQADGTIVFDDHAFG